MYELLTPIIAQFTSQVHPIYTYQYIDLLLSNELLSKTLRGHGRVTCVSEVVLCGAELRVVQGVGFRFFTEDAARREGLGGFVRNLADGQVEAVVEGDVEAVVRFERAIRQGPPLARVDGVAVERPPPTGRFDRFAVQD